MNKMLRFYGFTLIELMIAVAIVAIVATIAIPSYQQYMGKARRADAKAGLLSLQLAQEQYRANCTQYASTIGSTYGCASGNYTVVHGSTSPDGYYDLSVVSASTTDYTLQAARKSGTPQATDKCGDFRIIQNGTKSVVNAASGYSASNCW